MATFTPKQDAPSSVDSERPISEKPATVDKKPESESGSTLPPEVGGPTGPEPTRYGDWERNGRCTDF